MSEKKNTPAATSKNYDIMSGYWNKVNAVLGGTETMREHPELLPQHARETNTAYRNRLEKAVLYNITKLTLQSWVGRPFSKPIVIDEGMPEAIVNLTEDIDLQGNNLDVFARHWFSDGVAKAFSHVLVDFPVVPDDEKRTRADDLRDNLRPYWVHIPPEDVIYMESQVIGGAEVLTHVRIMETVTERQGFLERCYNQIRVLEPGSVTIYREIKDPKSKKVEWQLDSEFTTSLNYIPLVTFYADRQGLALGLPPLMDLVNLNISHWQKQSDQDACLEVARFPMLALSGGIDEDNAIEIGPRKLLTVKEANGKFYYVEHSGKAIDSGRQDLQDVMNAMSQYGAEFLKKRPSHTTASARLIDSTEATSPLQDVSLRFNDALEQAIWITADWMKIKRDQVPGVHINIDFGLPEAENMDLNSLIKARENKDISRETFLHELKRRGILREDFDAEKDEAELEEEMMDMLNNQAKMLDLDPENPNRNRRGNEEDDDPNQNDE